MPKLIGLQNIAIDLDDTILEIDWNEWRKYGMDYFGDPKPGAIKALKKLRAANHKIIIHTCRTSRWLSPEYTLEELKEKIEDALHKRDVPFDEVWIGTGKPLAPFYVDDRAIEFRGDWKEIVKRIFNSSRLGD